MFAANALGWWAPQIRAGDVVRWPYLAAPTAPIDERDIAAVAVRALCEDGHAGAEYVLTGPQSLSQFEQVSTIGDAIGRSLRIEEISPDEARRELLTLMPAFVVNMLLDAWAAAIGQPALVTSTVARDHRSAGTNVPRLGDRSRRGVSGVIRKLSTSPATLNVGWAGKFMDEWRPQTMRSRIEPMKKIARCIRQPRELILNYFGAKN